MIAPVFSGVLPLSGVFAGTFRSAVHAASAPGGIGPRGVTIDFKTVITDAFIS
jgi:hypothetical protein